MRAKLYELMDFFAQKFGPVLKSKSEDVSSLRERVSNVRVPRIRGFGVGGRVGFRLDILLSVVLFVVCIIGVWLTVFYFQRNVITGFTEEELSVYRLDVARVVNAQLGLNVDVDSVFLTVGDKRGDYYAYATTYEDRAMSIRVAYLKATNQYTLALNREKYVARAELIELMQLTYIDQGLFSTYVDFAIDDNNGLRFFVYFDDTNFDGRLERVIDATLRKDYVVVTKAIELAESLKFKLETIEVKYIAAKDFDRDRFWREGVQDAGLLASWNRSGAVDYLLRSVVGGGSGGFVVDALTAELVHSYILYPLTVDGDYKKAYLSEDGYVAEALAGGIKG